MIVRAFRPGASRIVSADDGPVRCADDASVTGSGLFEAIVEDRVRSLSLPARGSLSRRRIVVTIHDPYSFLPTLGDLDLYLWGEQKHDRAYDKLGAHVREMARHRGRVVRGVGAQRARRQRGRRLQSMGRARPHDAHARQLGRLGDVHSRTSARAPITNIEIRTRDGDLLLKSDPFAQRMELPPATASVVYRIELRVSRREWMKSARAANAIKCSGVDLRGASRLVAARARRGQSLAHLSRDGAASSATTSRDMGFTHVELMPVMEHPFTGSWGYQVSGYFAPTSRYGTPDDLRYLIDEMHRRGIGVILDWVPAHFPKDEFSLGRFDGTALFEHPIRARATIPTGAPTFSTTAAAEVRNFLTASALYWLGEFHADGLRVDAVASMIYLDYARRDGEWIPNALRRTRKPRRDRVSSRSSTSDVYALNPGVMMIAEESTAWTGVSRPVFMGGLGFGFKWDMGWMHDTLRVFLARSRSTANITIAISPSACSTRGAKISCCRCRMTKWCTASARCSPRCRATAGEQFANLRALYGYMWARSGKKLIFMGNEFGQWREWDHDSSLDWHLLEYPRASRVAARWCAISTASIATSPRCGRPTSSPAGFRWIDADNADDNVIAFMRIARRAPAASVICVCNFSPVLRSALSHRRAARGLLSRDSQHRRGVYGGSNVGNLGGVQAQAHPWHRFPYSISIELPPLSVMWFAAP